MHATMSIVRYQFLPFRDRSGRRILTVFPDEELEQMEPSVSVSLSVFCFAPIASFSLLLSSFVTFFYLDGMIPAFAEAHI